MSGRSSRSKRRINLIPVTTGPGSGLALRFRPLERLRQRRKSLLAPAYDQLLRAQRGHGVFGSGIVARSVNYRTPRCGVRNMLLHEIAEQIKCQQLAGSRCFVTALLRWSKLQYLHEFDTAPDP
jgi:hypothetical protein